MIQHSASGEAQTRDLLKSGRALYHWATVALVKYEY